MTYISPEKTKQIREELKKQFPSKDGWKFSLRNDGHTSLDCAIQKAPVKFIDEPYKQLNEYYLENYQNSETLKKIAAILNGDFLEEKARNFDHSDSMTDYFHRGWYVHIEVGQWNKPFELVVN